MRKNLTFLFLLCAGMASAQKKPLDHSVYDTWESVGTKQFSNDGNWAAYTINQQEGDAVLYFHHSMGAQQLKISRGTASSGFGGASLFSPDSKWAAFSIKPWYQDTRMARIKKKKADEMTKDTLGFVNLTTLAVTKIPRVKSFKFPETGAALLAYNMEKAPDTSRKRNAAAAASKNDGAIGFADDDSESNSPAKEGTDLILKNLNTGIERTFKYVTDYAFSKNGKLMVYTCSGSKTDKSAEQGVFLLNTETGKVKTLVKGKGNFKAFLFDEESEHLAFLGETSPEKAEIKDFNVYYNSLSLDTAQILVDKTTAGMPENYAVSGDGRLSFSQDGNRLFFGIAPVKKPKDTTLIDFEHAKLDIWTYKDDYLQPMQLKNVARDLRKSYLSTFDIYSADPKIVPLTDVKLPDASLMNEGNAPFVLAYTDYGRRIPSQWTGGSQRDYYLVNVNDGSRKMILENLSGSASASPAGNYVLYYDKTKRTWNTYQVASGKTTVLNAGMEIKFYDEDNDVPDEPGSYGVAGWTEDDKMVLIYDRYDIWAFSPDGKQAPKNLTNGFGRQNNLTFRVQRTDPDARFFDKKENLWLSTFNNSTKENGFYRKALNDNKNPELVAMAAAKYSGLTKAKNSDFYIYDKGSYVQSPDVYISKDLKTAVKLSSTNPQQANYNWGTAELVKWTTPKGYQSEGILYKPENFDPSKKYPMIVYFYEKLSEGLYAYNAPAPTPSRLNIPFFVSNGYLVFAPDISYETGHPGKSAEEFINSGVESLKKNTWVDGSKVGIQGQSWGGYQVAHLITATDMYAAAWAGAPVANMTSAYGGIRWESGMSRAFQYEKTQSRIGATLWEKPELYIENSPLFHLPNVKTPVVIMSNDADGAVPWYQGIELFSGLRRLGKPAWLLVYNNEAHNLVQRQNKKDIQIREQQFFDYYLKGAKAPVWMVDGVPATEKGKTWGFELTDKKP